MVNWPWGKCHASCVCWAFAFSVGTVNSTHNKYRYIIHLLHSHVNSKKTTLSIASFLTVMLYLPTSSSVKSRNMMVLLTMLTLSMSDISWPSSLTKDAIQGTGLPLIFTVIVMFWPTCSCVLGGLGSGTSNPIYTKKHKDRMQSWSANISHSSAHFINMYFLNSGWVAR